MVSERIRDRYLRDPLPVQLGGLAADLARMASCAEDSRDRQALMSLMEEGKWFAEWAAEHAPLDVQEQLAEVQVWLACWEHRWLCGRLKPGLSEEAQRWSDCFLELSGLAGER